MYSENKHQTEYFIKFLEYVRLKSEIRHHAGARTNDRCHRVKSSAFNERYKVLT